MSSLGFSERGKMALNETVATKKLNTEKVVSAAGGAINSSTATHYDSIGTQAGYEIDVLAQLKANLSQVEDLSKKLHFVLNEVSGLIKKS